MRDSYRRIRTAIARINAFTQEHVTGMSVVQLFGREQRAFNDFEAVNRTHMVAFKDAIMAYALYYPAVELLSSIAIALVIWIGGRGVLRGTVTIGILVAFIQYSQRFWRPIQDLSDKYNILQAAMAASERVFRLLDTPAEVTAPPDPLPSPRAGRIEFRNVWFTYERLTPEQLSTIAAASPEDLEAIGVEWILRGVSFTIEPNETAAIVGHTGAGKTTIISLMMRFYDVQRGQVLIDGIDVRQHDLTALRQHFGVVLQDPFLFTGTIAENIRLGTKSISDADMERAADEVNVLDFIRTLPHGFNEPLRERGAGLSTGQKQLINFARALAHRPRILILDEATSSVDTDTEIRVRSRARPHGHRPHLGRHRAPPLHRPARRHHPRHAQRPAPRARPASAAPRAARHLLEALPAPVQGPGARSLLRHRQRSARPRHRLRNSLPQRSRA